MSARFDSAGGGWLGADLLLAGFAGLSGANVSDLVDWDLLEKAKNGNSDAFRTLVERHHASAVAFASQILRDHQSAEDVVQRGFGNVHRSLDRFEPRARFRTLLFRIVKNLAINELRRRDAAPVGFFDNGAEGEVDPTAVARSVDRRSADPAMEIENHEVDEMVRRAMATLRPEHRGALYLREQRGLSYQEIAEVLDASLAEVKIWIHRARKTLLERLAPYLERGDEIA